MFVMETVQPRPNVVLVVILGACQACSLILIACSVPTVQYLLFIFAARGESGMWASKNCVN